MISVGNIAVCRYGDNKDLFCVEPKATRRQRAAWIMWVDLDGSAVLYTERDENGAVVESSKILLSANLARKKR